MWLLKCTNDVLTSRNTVGGVFDLGSANITGVVPMGSIGVLRVGFDLQHHLLDGVYRFETKRDSIAPKLT